MRWTILVPLIGLVIAACFPVLQYAQMERDERTAIDVLRQVHAAQADFQQRSGGYAGELASLTVPCSDERPPLSREALSALEAAGYIIELHRAHDAAIRGRDCRGRETVADYYLAAAPKSATVAARQAFAGRRDGRLYFFYDGIPPREGDIEGGLATPVELRGSFRIP